MGESLTTVKLQFIERFKDRYGKTRHYFRRSRSERRIALPGEPGSPEFMGAYLAALNGEVAPSTPKEEPRQTTTPREEDRTFAALATIYYRTPEYRDLKTRTAHVYRLVIDRFLTKHGTRRADQMKRIHVKTIMADMADRPGAANDLLKKLRLLMKLAIELEWRTDDPTQLIKTYDEGEFHTWTEEEIAQFERRWAPGTPERTAFALHLYTGQRRGDVCRLTWPSEGLIRVKQGKTEVELLIPVHPVLEEVLTHWPRRGEVILINQLGKPFTPNGFGNFIGDAIRAAGLPKHCSSHGLRKAAARRLAEAGCSEKQIAAITGHTTLKEVARYTRAASQEQLARAAFDRLAAAKAASEAAAAAP